MDFLETLFYTVLAIFFLGCLARLLFRTWLERKLRQFERHGGDASRGFHWSRTYGGQRREERREGDVSVSGKPEDGLNMPKSVGEYVEYEEVVEETITEEVVEE